MSNSVWIVFAVIALIVSRLVKWSAKKVVVNLPKKEWQNERKNIFETLFEVENLEKKSEKSERMKSELQGTKKELRKEVIEIEESSKLNEEMKEERKFSLKEAVIYNAILERPYR
jgi:uncharacterized protein (TIGR02588 family)